VKEARIIARVARCRARVKVFGKREREIGVSPDVAKLLWTYI